MTNTISPNAKRLMTLLTLALFSAGFVFYVMEGKNTVTYKQESIVVANGSSRTAKAQGMTLDMEGCQIPHMNPFDSSVIHLIRRTKGTLCGETSSVTYQDSEWLRLNKSIIHGRYYNKLSYCKYWPILRADNNDHSYKLGNLEGTFFEDFLCKKEFIKVSCYDKNNVSIYTNVHVFVHVKDDVEARCTESFKKHLAQSGAEDKLNVFLVGLDAVSRANTVRHLPRTRAFFREHFETFEMLGYHKVGHNTFPNMLPLTCGFHDSEIAYPIRSGRQHFDSLKFIWKEFSVRGYRTQFADEYPDWGMFHYWKRGFEKPPTDYYAVGIFNALGLAGPQFDKSAFCVADRLRTSLVLDYGLDFARMFKNKPYFSFVYNTKLTHNELNKAGYADEPHLNLLKRLKKENLLNNTVLMFFSDHGILYGPQLDTFIGKLEASLPFMFIVLPKWFLDKYPQIKKNLKTNTNRLTTPFDIYATLKDILYFNGHVNNNVSVYGRSVSLFQEIPSNRTCVQADIAMSLCACKRVRPTSVLDKTVQAAAATIVDKINKYLSHVRHICAFLKLKRVHKAYIVEGYDQVKQNLKNSTLFQIQVETSPGGGLFDAVVKYDITGKVFSIFGNAPINRINKYGSQSACVKEHRLLQFCFCQPSV